MAEEPDNLTLRMLRQIDGKLDTVIGKVQDLIATVSSIEDQFVGLRSEISALRADFVRLS